MRRLAQHALAGVGFVAVVSAISVVGLSSPAADDVATAVPAVSTSATPEPAVAAARGDAELRLAVQRARRNDVAAVKAERARAKAAKQAAKRSSRWKVPVAPTPSNAPSRGANHSRSVGSTT